MHDTGICDSSTFLMWKKGLRFAPLSAPSRNWEFFLNLAVDDAYYTEIFGFRRYSHFWFWNKGQNMALEPKIAENLRFSRFYNRFQPGPKGELRISCKGHTNRRNIQECDQPSHLGPISKSNFSNFSSEKFDFWPKPKETVSHILVCYVCGYPSQRYSSKFMTRHLWAQIKIW